MNIYSQYNPFFHIGLSIGEGTKRVSGNALLGAARFAKRTFSSVNYGQLGRTGSDAARQTGEFLWRNRASILRRGVINPAKFATHGAIRVGKGIGALSRIPAPLFAVPFIAYEISRGKNASEGIMRGGVETAATATGFAAGAIAGGIAGSWLPGIGTLIGSAIGGYMGYKGTSVLGMMGINKKEAPKFENVYMNRRALTMRQASEMELAKSSRAAFGNEASLMHLR